MVKDFNSYTPIVTGTTTQVFTGVGRLIAIIVNATANGTIGIFDATAAASTATIGTLKASVAEGTYTYNCEVGAGLKIITGSTSDITVIWAR